MTIRERIWRSLLGDNYVTDGDRHALETAATYLTIAATKLQAAMANLGVNILHRKAQPFMASPLLQNITDDVNNATTVVKSATLLVTGFQQRLEDAIAAAIAGGATEAQLQPVSDLSDALEADAALLASAIAAHTPMPPVTP